MISAFVGKDHRDWDLHVHEFRHAVNTAVQSSTKVSPAFLNYGRHPRPVVSLRREIEGNQLVEKLDPKLWEDRMKRLDAIRDLVGRHIDRARERQEKTYNRGKRDVQFSVGDQVMRRTQFLSKGADKFNAKLAPKFEGPYEIVEVKSPTVVELGQGEGSNRRITKAHVSTLKRYIPPRRCNQVAELTFCHFPIAMPESPSRTPPPSSGAIAAESTPPATPPSTEPRLDPGLEPIVELPFEHLAAKREERFQRRETRKQTRTAHMGAKERRAAAFHQQWRLEGAPKAASNGRVEGELLGESAQERRSVLPSSGATNFSCRSNQREKPASYRSRYSVRSDITARSLSISGRVLTMGHLEPKIEKEETSETTIQALEPFEIIREVRTPLTSNASVNSRAVEARESGISKESVQDLYGARDGVLEQAMELISGRNIDPERMYTASEALAAISKYSSPANGACLTDPAAVHVRRREILSASSEKPKSSQFSISEGVHPLTSHGLRRNISEHGQRRSESQSSSDGSSGVLPDRRSRVAGRPVGCEVKSQKSATQRSSVEGLLRE